MVAFLRGCPFCLESAINRELFEKESLSATFFHSVLLQSLVWTVISFCLSTSTSALTFHEDPKLLDENDRSAEPYLLINTKGLTFRFLFLPQRMFSSKVNFALLFLFYWKLFSQGCDQHDLECACLSLFTHFKSFELLGGFELLSGAIEKHWPQMLQLCVLFPCQSCMQMRAVTDILYMLEEGAHVSHHPPKSKSVTW